MHGSGTAREARRRPELDLLVGPLEAAAAGADEPTGPQAELIGLADAKEPPAWREDG
jgi:hypothetical protein